MSSDEEGIWLEPQRLGYCVGQKRQRLMWIFGGEEQALRF